MAQYTKEIFVKDYFDIHNHYVKIFGKSTLILMQVGSFHECYNTDTDGPDLHSLGEHINMTVTQKDKRKPLSISNPRMMGFPSYIVEDMVERIIMLGYTIIRIDQTTEPPLPKREIVGIFSPATTIQHSNSKNTNLNCIIFDAIKLKTPNPILCIGIASYDMMTGQGCVYETVSTTYDTMIALDNIVRFLEKYPPCETIYHFSSGLYNFINTNTTINRMNMNDIIRYIGIRDNMTTYKLSNIDMITNVKYQMKLIDDIFKNNLDNINLHAYNYARIALVGLLEFARNHQPIILTRLTEPSYYNNNDTLYLGNKALEQLDVLPSNDKPKTLFDIICKTKTPMGRRYMIDQLCNPLISPDVLNGRYDVIEILMKNSIYETINNELVNIVDIPRITRKMELNKIYPNELVSLYQSLVQIRKVYRIVRTIEENDRKVIKNVLSIDKSTSLQLKTLCEHIEGTFDLKYLENMSYANYKDETINYILNNNYPNIMLLTKKIKTSNNFMDLLVQTLEKYIEEINSSVISKNTSPIILKYNDRDGHYMLLTKRRCKILREKVDKMKEINIGGIMIQVKDLEFNDLPKSNNVKISCRDILKISVDTMSFKTQLAKELKEAFYTEIVIIIESYRDLFISVSNTIKQLDFLNSGAHCAYMNGYCKPIIEYNTNSFFEASNLRHPIVEIINTDVAYHPHNISLGRECIGMLIHGINAAGKSTLMKSMGLAIIMAQIGYYTPATNFVYSPYKNLFTRIKGNDDMYNGLSSFMVEMTELVAILKRNNNNTLVIADEICKGTEIKSSTVIISYMLETLAKHDTSFITATHIHNLSDMESIKKLDNIKVMHIHISYDETNDKLIYDRILKDGSGPDYYGVLIAKYMLRDDIFNNRTKELEQEYDDYCVKRSNYNKNLLMIECCICKSKKSLETHHINFQKDCDDIKVVNKPHIKKNAGYNLTILCSKCHDLVDKNIIIINGWVNTSKGVVLDYKKIELTDV